MFLRLSFLTGICFAFSFSAFGLTDPCSTLADLTSQNNPNTFVGYGVGASKAEADNNAQVDMASRIRSKVTAVSVVSEDNTSANLNSTSKSVISEVLVGVNAIKRCNIDSKEDSTVLTLDKTVFISSLENKLSAHIDQAKKLKDVLTQSKNDEIIANSVDKAKKLIEQYQSTFDDDLQLCKLYKGCASFKEGNVFQELPDIVAKLADKDQYVLISNDNQITANFRDELIDLLTDDGVKVMDGSVTKNAPDSVRKILAKCRANLKGKIPNSDDRVLETRCVVEGYTGKQKLFRKVYSCSAMVDADSTKDDAISACNDRLQKE
jgi:hypothetical protein